MADCVKSGLWQPTLAFACLYITQAKGGSSKYVEPLSNRSGISSASRFKTVLKIAFVR